jgi:hypothetical protein
VTGPTVLPKGNPLWVGFARGWFGPDALMLLLGRFMPGGQGGSTSGAPAPEVPATPSI